MMMEFILSHLLISLIALPGIAGVVVYLSGCAKESKCFSFGLSIIFSLLIGGLLGYIAVSEFDYSMKDLQFVAQYKLSNSYGVNFDLGIDGISLSMIILTAFVSFACVIVGHLQIKERNASHYSLLFMTQSVLFLAFSTYNVMMFYIAFEMSLIPLFMIIGMWGGKNKLYAAFKFFLYTFAFSMLMLLALVYIHNTVGTFDIHEILHKAHIIPLGAQKMIWWAFFMAFAVKIPMFPIHTWLPDAHVQAPTGGSMILAGVLLKLGAYGMLRFLFPLFPALNIEYASIACILSIIAIIYASLIAWVQTDIKKLIAYSSIAHMGYVTLGLFAFNALGAQGAIMQMISHGFISAALFLCVGIIYSRTGTRDINDYGGLADIMKKYSVFFVAFSLASAGLPGTSGFVGEFLVILGLFKSGGISYGILAAIGPILSAIYMLHLCKKIIFGARPDKCAALQDIGSMEYLLLTALLLPVIFIGVYPEIVIRIVESSNYLVGLGE